MEVGLRFAARGRFVTAPKVPSPFPGKMVTSALPKFATAKSAFPSRLKSPTAAEMAKVPAERLLADPKEPVPSPSRTETPESAKPLDGSP
jgi:hypothetical protein